MEKRRWLNPSLPQTLQIANFLLYFTGFFTALDVLRFVDVPGHGFVKLLFFAEVALCVAGGFGIANERKWGYTAGVAGSFGPIFLYWALYGYPTAIFRENIISLMFDIALVALLLHPMSREHQRIWFK